MSILVQDKYKQADLLAFSVMLAYRKSISYQSFIPESIRRTLPDTIGFESKCQNLNL